MEMVRSRVAQLLVLGPDVVEVVDDPEVVEVVIGAVVVGAPAMVVVVGDDDDLPQAAKRRPNPTRSIAAARVRPLPGAVLTVGASGPVG